jgi:asparagine synthase (glutamine-hydrolysing)
MCGLCGVVAHGRPPQTAMVERMLDEIAHRGPDGRGIFADDGVALGHLRLAIIDLSDVGLQPFELGGLRLLHNGEIYNYVELREELRTLGHSFRSETDTEVLLAAYREWGEACVERFNGIWAFAIWDPERRTLFASRDRFGVKPLYYRLDGDCFAFASEPWTLRDDDRRPNLRAVRDYLEQGWLDQGEETFFDGVRRLAPAHNLTFGPDGLRIRRYWSLEPKDAPGDPTAAVRETFLDAIRLQLRSDVPVGTALSGGIDSSAIAVGVAHQGLMHQKTISAYFEDAGYDERPYARTVVEATGAEPHWVSFTADELLESLPAIVRAQGEPFGSTSIAAGWHVMRAARAAGLTVMLDGQGGDELFAGYRAAYGYRVADLVAAGRVVEAGRELSAFWSRHRTSPVAAAGVLARPFLPERLGAAGRARLKGAAGLAHPTLRSLPRPSSANGYPFPDRLRRHLAHTLTHRGLPELLRYEDRNSMAHSIEARVPFLDHRLVELAYSLDGAELLARGQTKAVLRRALADLLPPQVRDRKDKLGFVTPEGRFMREALGDLAAETFASREFRERGLVSAEAASERLRRHRSGDVAAGMELWRALNVELWARTFLDA